MRAALAAIAFIAFIEPAAARHHHRCGPRQILRVSMGICVGARSRLAREVERAPRRLERPKEPLYYVTVVIPAGRPPEAQETPPDVDIPYSLPGSRMWNPPGRFTPWVVR